jgi:hypothetical protein
MTLNYEALLAALDQQRAAREVDPELVAEVQRSVPTRLQDRTLHWLRRMPAEVRERYHVIQRSCRETRKQDAERQAEARAHFGCAADREMVKALSRDGWPDERIAWLLDFYYGQAVARETVAHWRTSPDPRQSEPLTMSRDLEAKPAS